MADGIIKNLMAVIEAAEQLDRDTFEAEHIELDNGRSLLLVAITGENLDGMAMVMEGLCMTALESARARQVPAEYPYDSTVKLKYYGDESCTGWAHRGENGELLSAYARTPLDPDASIVVEERGA
ncbi:hypothetical protein [Pseudomonas anguilliseptica]|uniref:Uncharacterized protein n=1 Tax=Pseudomonas anguilliseptica TaxID=53406 RepID=A0A1H5B1F2_PSEAG|nr:hypothetical protein [Pseudomonas anguilliseptica]SED48302.1 hypothetical protein SAMN05421553_2742 [Pseudomonas anguilliseptica]